tara:strand:+ start:6580 stop:10344 length:3765 start_codon:yes stop_codon:yes gene_type:complete
MAEWWEQSYDDYFESQTGLPYSGTAGQAQEEEDKITSLMKLQDRNFISNLKDYYTYRDGEDFKYDNDADVIDYFYSDRTWRNFNTVSIGKELSQVLGENNPDRLRQFSEINKVYQNLPSFWDDPNRNFGQWLMDFGGAMLADPLNLIGVGVGGQVAKNEYRRQLRNALRGKIAKEIDEQLIKKLTYKANKKALGSAIARGGMWEGLFSGMISGTQDTMLQMTAIETGVEDEFSIKRLGLNTAFGFGMGTLFGGAFSAGGFKLALRGQRKNTVKNLQDIHNYGFDELRGKRLFSDLAEVKPKGGMYKNKSAEEIARIRKYNKIEPKDTSDYIKKLRENARLPFGKPPKEPFNFKRWAEGDEDHTPVELIRQHSIELKKLMDEDVAKQNFQTIREEAAIAGLDPDALVKQIKEIGNTNIAANMLAMRQLIKKHADSMIKTARQLDDISLNNVDKQKYITEFQQYRELVMNLLIIQKSAQRQISTALASQRQAVDKEKAIELLVMPEGGKIAKQLEGNPEDYMRAVAKIYDDNHMILSLQNAQKVNRWDLAAEYVNNNLLSSPDTHILNIASGLMQTQWKPLVMLLRAAYLNPTDSARAKIVAGEALDTYIYQYYYLMDAVMSGYRSFKAGRPVLDSRALKYDSNIRQGQLANWLNEMVKIYTGSGAIGRGIQKVASVPIWAVTAPLRVLSAGDEFLKTMTFKARAAAQVNSRIMRDHPDIAWSRLNRFKDRKQYKELAQKYLAEYMDESGQGKTSIQGLDNSMSSQGLTEADRLEVNDPLHYAREASYTQPATSQAQMADGTFTGATEGRVTGAVLSFTAKHRWTRALGLHFINTPSNLIRWNFQHLPVLGRYQFQMKQMLKKNNAGEYINPEAAAEANARITMGYAIWVGAFTAAIYGKVTGGGERDWRKNKQRTQDTGWKPYSYKTSDGRYVSLNRLDPFFTPFGIAADMVHALDKFLAHNESLTPYQESRMTELSMGVITSLSRNFSSKFYTKGMLETVDLFLGDGLMTTKDPERKSALFLGRFGFKFAPLSGMMRYINRVNDDYQRELWTLTDQINSYRIFDDPDAVMPQRNMFGEKIDRENGWLFGLGGKSGLWSSPFAMTEFANTETAKFFENREINYVKPSKKDKHTDINLKDLKNNDGQTAYDRWMEIKSEIRLPYKGANMTLKEIIEYLVKHKRSELYRLPEGNSRGVVEGIDFRQDVIVNLVRQFESAAYEKMSLEFPQIYNERMRRDTSIYKAQRNALDDFLQSF